MSNKEKNGLNPAAETAAEAPEKKKHNFKKLKFGSMSVIVLILVIAIVIVINLMAGLLSKRYPLKVDLTPDKRYELSDESIEVLQNLDKNVEITVTNTRDTFANMSAYFEQMYQQYGVNLEMPYEMIPEILDKYKLYAESSKGGIDVKYVDMNRDPDIISRYSKYYNGEIQEGSIVVYCNERVKVIASDEVVNMIRSPQSGGGQVPTSMNFAGESVITSAIMSVTDTNPMKVAIVKTMNGNALYETRLEPLSTSLESFLSKNGYDCVDVDIATDEISPADYDLLVVQMPNVDFSADIITKLSDFLYNDGNYQKNLLYIPSLTATNLPNIDEFLADWSIKVEPSIILDDNMISAPLETLGMNDASPVMAVSDAESVGTLANEKLPIAAPYTKALTVISKNNERVVKEVLKSSSTSYLTDLSTGEKGETGSFNAALLSSRSKADGLDVNTSNLLVLGSTFFADNALLTYSNTYNNANVLISMVNNMTGKENGVVIAEKALQQSNIAVTGTEGKVIRWIVIAVIPLIVALAGTIVLLRRRNK